MENKEDQSVLKRGKTNMFFKGLLATLTVVASLTTTLMFFYGGNVFSERISVLLIPCWDFIRIAGIVIGALAVLVGCIRRSPFFFGSMSMLAVLVFYVWLSVGKAKENWNLEDADCSKILSVAHAVGVGSDGEFRFTVGGGADGIWLRFESRPIEHANDDVFISTIGLEEKETFILKRAIENMEKFGLVKPDDGYIEANQPWDEIRRQSYVLTLKGIERAKEEFDKAPIDVYSEPAASIMASSITSEGVVSRSYYVRLRPWQFRIPVEPVEPVEPVGLVEPIEPVE